MLEMLLGFYDGLSRLVCIAWSGRNVGNWPIPLARVGQNGNECAGERDVLTLSLHGGRPESFRLLFNKIVLTTATASIVCYLVAHNHENFAGRDLRPPRGFQGQGPNNFEFENGFIAHLKNERRHDSARPFKTKTFLANWNGRQNNIYLRVNFVKLVFLV